MISERRLQMLTSTLRFLVGGVFIYTGCTKLLHPAEFAAAIAEYRILISPAAIMLASYALPLLEILCGIGLIIKRTASLSSAVIAGLLLVFIAAIFSAAVRGLDISCGCFGESGSGGNAGVLRLLEDVVLLAVTLVLRYAPGKRMETHSS